MFNLMEKPINTKTVIIQQIKGVDQLLNRYSLFQHKNTIADDVWMLMLFLSFY